MSTAPAATPPRARAWLARLYTLRVKLFLAIAGTNMVLVIAAYLIYSWSFDKGLVDYLNQADEARLRPMVLRLAEGYRQQGSWAWIASEPQRWSELTREVLGTGRMPRRPADAAPGGAPEGPPAPPPVDPRLLLFDAQRQLLLGPEYRRDQAALLPITVDKTVVGYLGYMPRLRIAASLEHVFQAEQARIFTFISLGLLVAVLLTAALIARWLSGRLRALSVGTAAVARGDYSVRLPAAGHDELARLAQDFNHMALSLQAAQQARRQWIADIAHELRTPLATLRAEIEALQDGVRAPDAANLQSLAQETGRLTRLVDDLRLLSLSDLGALGYRLETLDLGRFVAHHLADAVGLQARPGLQLRSELPSGVHIRADGDRLDQVLANLLQNTLRYSDDPATLHVSVQTEGGEALLVWEDSAPGVPDDALPRLTERLFRVDGSRASVSGGSGLGLAITRAIVEGHGGRLQAAHSTLGGLRWELRFPLASESGHG